MMLGMTIIHDRPFEALRKAWISEDEAIQKYHAKCVEHTEIVGQLSNKLSKVQKDKEYMAERLAQLGFPQYIR